MRYWGIRRGVLLSAFLAAIGLMLPSASALGSTAQSSSATCASANAALEEGGLEKARQQYLDILASTPSSQCAVQGLNKVTLATHAEALLCSEAKVLAEHNQAVEARRRYIAALAKNIASQCAVEGLGGAKKKGDEKSWLETWSTGATNLDKLGGSVLIALLVLVGAVGLAVTMVRRRKASLTIEPFADGAAEPKVGSTVAGLVEGRLVALAHHGKRSSDSYQLDLLVADVEILSTNESLDAALSGLADASQFKLAVAVLGLLDRTFGTHLVAKGELAPKGDSGHGLLLSMHSQKPGNQARGVLWDLPVGAGPPPPAPVAAAAGGAGAGGEAKPDPDPYYKLVDRAAAWVQYEAALSLDSRVGVITSSADSFSLVAEGLAEQRVNHVASAARLYARALQVDSENVAALINLSYMLARHADDFANARMLLERARAVLQNRYEEME
jgi:tetratricopeptide (TPR) repeat protein